MEVGKFLLPPLLPSSTLVCVCSSSPTHAALPHECLQTLRVYLPQPGGGKAFIIPLNASWKAGGEGLWPANGGCAVGFRDLLPPPVSVCPLLPLILSVLCCESVALHSAYLTLAAILS